MMRLLYTLLIYLAAPLILFFLYRPKKGQPGFGPRWKEHLGLVTPASAPNPIWVHAVSVGETLAVTPLIKVLHRQYPDTPIVLTTTTRTGADQAARLGNLVEHRYAPLDYPFAVKQFLKRIQPQALIIMETELWPNLLHHCGKRNIPVIILNARLSERSCQRYQRVRVFFRNMSQNIRLFLCQHRDDAARFRRLGVSAGQIAVTGSIKFDIRLDQTQIEQGAQDRKQLRLRPVWIAASTHKGEDEQILDAHRQIRLQCPQALLILVPRHPERFAAVQTLCQTEGFSTVTRSSQQPVTDDVAILLGDTMGEMAYYLQLADVAFIGGSLVPVGGHNLLEPAALAKPALTGPHYFNFSDITRQLTDNHACLIIQNAQELAHEISRLLQDEVTRQQMGMAAFDVVAANQGALDKSLQAIARVLDQR